jgi:hypothetical protein
MAALPDICDYPPLQPPQDIISAPSNPDENID